MKVLTSIYFKHQTIFSIISLMAGFGLSLWRGRPIDTDAALLQQAITLILLFALLMGELAWRGGSFRPSTRVQKWWRWHELVIHFLLGGLLRGYAVFFIKSGGTQGSIAFLILITLLMSANELPFVQNKGTLVRTSLWSLALSCFLTYLIPKLTHQLGSDIFTLSLGLAVVFVLLAYLFIHRKVPSHLSRPFFLYPTLATLAGYLALYHLALIPPVPLMLSRFEIAHQVQKDGSHWLMLQLPQKPKQWPWDPQQFFMRSGDHAVAAFRLVAPPLFVEELYVRWESQQTAGWAETDRIPVKIQGGRKEGFRGTTEKANLWPGHWRVKLETKDHREIGRVYFDISLDESEQVRDFLPQQF